MTTLKQPATNLSEMKIQEITEFVGNIISKNNDEIIADFRASDEYKIVLISFLHPKKQKQVEHTVLNTGYDSKNECYFVEYEIFDETAEKKVTRSKLRIDEKTHKNLALFLKAYYRNGNGDSVKTLHTERTLCIVSGTRKPPKKEGYGETWWIADIENPFDFGEEFTRACYLYKK